MTTCSYTSRRFTCDRPATHHVLFSRNPDYVSWSCDEHFAAVLGYLDPVDHHPVGAACGVPKDAGGYWRFTTPQRQGFCYVRGEDEIDALLSQLVLEPVVHGSDG